MGEVVDHRKPHQIPEVSKLFGPFAKSIKAVGFKVFYGLSHRGYAQLLEEVLQDPKIIIVHLIRQDFKAQYASLRLAKQQKAWTRQKASTFPAINTDPSDLNTFRANIDSERAMILSKVTNHKRVQIYYEDLCRDPKANLDRVLASLQVPERPLFSVLKKQAPTFPNTPN